MLKRTEAQTDYDFTIQQESTQSNQYESVPTKLFNSLDETNNV